MPPDPAVEIDEGDRGLGPTDDKHVDLLARRELAVADRARMEGRRLLTAARASMTAAVWRSISTGMPITVSDDQSRIATWRMRQSCDLRTETKGSWEAADTTRLLHATGAIAGAHVLPEKVRPLCGYLFETVRDFLNRVRRSRTASRV